MTIFKVNMIVFGLMILIVSLVGPAAAQTNAASANVLASTSGLFGEWSLTFDPPMYVSAFNEERRALARFHVMITSSDPGRFSGTVSWNGGAGPRDTQQRKSALLTGELRGSRVTIWFKDPHDGTTLIELSGNYQPSYGIVTGNVANSGSKGLPKSGSFTMSLMKSATESMGSTGQATLGLLDSSLLGKWQITKTRSKVESKASVDNFCPASVNDTWQIQGSRAQGYTITTSEGTYNVAVESRYSSSTLCFQYKIQKGMVQETLSLQARSNQFTGLEGIRIRPIDPYSSIGVSFVEYKITGRKIN